MEQKSSFKNRKFIKKSLILLALVLMPIVIFAQEKQGVFMPNTPVKQTQQADSMIIIDPVPQFTGGSKAMFKFLADNIRYSVDSTGINGKVYVAFMVNTDGTISDITIKRGSNPALNEEVKRVVKLMSGKWTCGYQNGVPVRVAYTLPVSMRVE